MYTKAQVVALQKAAAQASERARSAYASWALSGKGKTEVGRMSLITYGNQIGAAAPAPAPKAIVESAKIRASRLAPHITDRTKADQVMALTEKHLTAAENKIDELNFLHHFTGLKESLRQGVASNRYYINNKLRPSLPKSGALSENDRMRVALTIVLAEDTLRRYDELTKDKDLQFWHNYKQALGTIIKGAAELLKEGAVAAAKAVGMDVLVPVAVAVVALGGLAVYLHGRGTAAVRG